MYALLAKAAGLLHPMNEMRRSKFQAIRHFEFSDGNGAPSNGEEDGNHPEYAGDAANQFGR
jgi:hypothetical protein